MPLLVGVWLEVPIKVSVLIEAQLWVLQLTSDYEVVVRQRLSTHANRMRTTSLLVCIFEHNSLMAFEQIVLVVLHLNKLLVVLHPSGVQWLADLEQSLLYLLSLEHWLVHHRLACLIKP